MGKSQSKIAVDVVLSPPDEIMDKAIELNQALLKTFEFDNKIVLNKQNCFPHISLAMGCIKKDDIPKVGTVLKDIAENFSSMKLTILDIRSETIPTGEKVSGFEIVKTTELQLLHETVMNKLSQYFIYNVSLDTIYALPNQQVEEVTTYWIKKYPKESSFEKFSPHITIGFGEVESENSGLKFPIQFSVSKLALCHLGNYCTCGEILLLHELIENNEANYGCTIIIPTYNRPEYLRRILSYYNGYGQKYNIIVADSSSDENKKSNKKIISSLSNLTLLHLSDYPSTISLFHKIADALNHVNTKYCVFCADDEFITPNGINQSVDFLEKNPDFTVAHGYYISFCLKTDKREKQKFCWKPGYQHYESITFPDAKSRLFSHFSNYYATTFYAVHRTDFLKTIFGETVRFTEDVRFGELLPSMLTLIYGKMKRLDILYEASDADSITSGPYASLTDFIRAGTYNEKYAKFRDCLAMHLSKKSQLDVEESRRVVDKAMAAYMKKYYSINYNYKYILIYKMSNILDYFRLPEWVDEGIRALYRKLFLPKQRRKQMDDFRCSEDISSPKYYDDFNKIRLHVLSYSKK